MAVPVRAGADLRLLRAGLFSAVCVALSASGHALASGTGIAVWALLAGWAGVMLVVAPLAGRERSLPGIAAALLGGELGLHMLFCMGQTSVGAGPASGSAGVMALAERLLCHPDSAHLTAERAAQVVRLSGIDPPAVATPGVHAMGAMSLSMLLTPSMIAAHLASAVTVGWLLRRGEAALWQVVRLSLFAAVTGLLAAYRLMTRAACPVEGRRSTRRAAWTRVAIGPYSSAALRHCVIRRGPPAAPVAV